MRGLFLFVATILAASLVVFGDSQEPYKGDLDLDGDVDFADFLIFVENFGKTGGSIAVRVDTIHTTTIRTIYNTDTLYTDGRRYYTVPNDSLPIPPGLAGLSAYITKIPTGFLIVTTYLDRFGGQIGVSGKLWRNPDRVTVTISKDGRDLYQSNNLEYRRRMFRTEQRGIDILVLKSEIPDIYSTYDSHYRFWGVRVIAEYGGVEYSN